VAVPKHPILLAAKSAFSHSSPVLSAALGFLLVGAPGAARAQEALQASYLSDISSLAWIEGGLFVAVHDAKNPPEENDRSRVSLVHLPAEVGTPPGPAREAASGIFYENLEVDWPASKPNDLESIARILGSRQMLLAESGDDKKLAGLQRLFLATSDEFKQLGC
jgi:hypothetical protein